MNDIIFKISLAFVPLLILGSGTLQVGSDFYHDDYCVSAGFSSDCYFNDELDVPIRPFPNEMLTGDSRLASGVNFRSFGFKFADGWRIGYQDSVVYDERTFDYYYSLIPLPSLLIQYIRFFDGKTKDSAPWGEKVNDNANMGIFLEYKKQDLFSVYGQFFLDDFATGVLIGRKDFTPSKFAWSFGGTYESTIGDWAFYHAGATKYTFQSYRGDNYAYTYSPLFFFQDNGKLSFVNAQDIYMGYKNGENNLSFMMTYSNLFMQDKLAYLGSLELTFTGPQSPSNSFTEYFVPTGNFLVLFGSKKGVQTKFEFKNALSYKIYDWLSLMGELDLSLALNALDLSTDFDINAQEINSKPLYPYLAPSGKTKVDYKAFIGVKFTYDSLNNENFN